MADIRPIHKDCLNKVHKMLNVMRHEGYIDYGVLGQDKQRVKISFCGITAYIAEDNILQIRAHNLDIDIDGTHLVYKKGDSTVLDLWASRLSTFGPSRFSGSFTNPVKKEKIYAA